MSCDRIVIPMRPRQGAFPNGPHNRKAFEFALGLWESLRTLGAPAPTLTLPGAGVYDLQAVPELGLRAGIQLDERHAGLRLDLNGGSLACLGTPTWLDGCAVNAYARRFGYVDHVQYTPGDCSFTLADGDAANYKAGDCVLLFRESHQPPEGGRSPDQQVATILKVDGSCVSVDAPLAAGLTAAKWLAGARKCSQVAPGDCIVKTAFGRELQPGEWLFVGDGVGVNEAFGEFARISRVDDNTWVEFDRCLRRTYDLDRAFAIPGPWPQDIVIENGSVYGSLVGGESCSAAFRGCVGITLRNVDFVRGLPELNPQRVNVTTCHDAAFDRCRLDAGVQANSSDRVHFDKCFVRNLNAEEWPSDVTVRDSDLADMVWCNLANGGGGLKLLDCRVRGGADLILGPGSVMSGCEFVSAPGGHEAMLAGGRVVVRDCDFNGAFLHAYPGAGYLFDNVRCGALLFEPGATGTVRPPVVCTAVPMQPLPPDKDASEGHSE